MCLRGTGYTLGAVGSVGGCHDFFSGFFLSAIMKSFALIRMSQSVAAPEGVSALSDIDDVFLLRKQRQLVGVFLYVTSMMVVSRSSAVIDKLPFWTSSSVETVLSQAFPCEGLVFDRCGSISLPAMVRPKEGDLIGSLSTSSGFSGIQTCLGGAEPPV